VNGSVPAPAASAPPITTGVLISSNRGRRIQNGGRGISGSWAGDPVTSRSSHPAVRALMR
jgi:hypothetical protein